MHRLAGDLGNSVVITVVMQHRCAMAFRGSGDEKIHGSPTMPTPSRQHGHHLDSASGDLIIHRQLGQRTQSASDSRELLRITSRVKKLQRKRVAPASDLDDLDGVTTEQSEVIGVGGENSHWLTGSKSDSGECGVDGVLVATQTVFAQQRSSSISDIASDVVNVDSREDPSDAGWMHAGVVGFQDSHRACSDTRSLLDGGLDEGHDCAVLKVQLGKTFAVKEKGARHQATSRPS